MKRLLSLLLCLSMVLSMLPVSVFAAEPEDPAVPGQTEPVSETTLSTEAAPETTGAAETTEAAPVPVETAVQTEPVPAAEDACGSEAEEFYLPSDLVFSAELELPDSEELFAGYVEQQFYGGISLYGITAGSLLTDDLKLLYDALVPKLQEIASGQRDRAFLAIGKSLTDMNGSYHPADVTISFSGSSYTDAQNTLLHRALLADLPYELYWMDKTVGVHATAWTSGSGKLSLVELSFTVAEAYQSTEEGSDAYDLDTSKTGAASESAANAQQIVAQYAEKADYDKLLAYKDNICSLVSYNNTAASNTSTPYGDPWQLIYVFDNDSSTNVVCEGYAKAFQYLCDLSTFDVDVLCHSVTGTIPNGNHMWNIVSVEGQNYLVDVTNSDAGTVGANGSLFLVGGSGSITQGYTFAGLKFQYNETATSTFGTGSDSILNLASTKLTADTFPLTPMDSFKKMLSGTGEAVVSSELTLTESISIPRDLAIAEGGSLIVPRGIVLTVPAGVTLTNLGALQVLSGGTLTVNGTLSGNVPETVSGSTVSGSGTLCASAASLEDLTALLASAGCYGSVQIQLTGSLTLISSVTIPENVTLTLTNAQLTVPETVTLTNQGTICLGSGSTMTLESGAVLAGNQPVLTSSDAVFDDQNIMTQALLEALLASSDSVTLTQTLTLTGDLTIPAGKTLVVSGSEGALVIPEGITLTNQGSVQAVSGGTVTVTGSVSGNIPQADTGSTVSGTGSLTSTAGTPDELNTLLDSADQFGSVQLQLSGSMTLDTDVTIPENVTLELTDVQLTVSENVTVTNQGSITVGSGGTLTLENGAALEGTQPELTSPDAVFEDKTPLTQEKLEALLASSDSVTLAQALTLTNDLTIPEGKTLIISGKDIFLTIPEGKTLLNQGRIECLEQGGILSDGGSLSNQGDILTKTFGILDMTKGTYAAAEKGMVYSCRYVTDDGSLVDSTFCGIAAEYVTVVAEGFSEDSLLALLNQLESDPPAALDFQVTRDLTLTGALTWPSFGTMTVPEGVTVTVAQGADILCEGRILLAGQLVLEGKLDSTFKPIHITRTLPEDLAEEDVEAYLRSLILLTAGDLPDFVFPGLAPAELQCLLPNGSGTAEDPVIAAIGTAVPMQVSAVSPLGADVFRYYYMFQLVSGEGQLLADLYGEGYAPYDGAVYYGSQVQVRSEISGQVTLRITPTNTDFVSYGPEYARDITIHFQKPCLEVTADGESFLSGSDYGLWAGSTLTLTPQLWDEFGSEMPGAISYALDSDEPQAYTEPLTITAPADLAEARTTTVTFTADGADPLQVTIVMKPVIAAVDVVCEEQTVTGQTLLMDLDGRSPQVRLTAAVQPADAFLEDGSRIRWTSSNEGIATVDDSGTVTFTGQKTGSVTISVTASFGAEQTASVTFQVVDKSLAITSHEDNPTVLIGGSKGSFLAVDPDGTTLKTSQVQWFLCDENGEPIDAHPYASVTAAGKLTTKAVADPDVVYLMAETESSSLFEPVAVMLYPAISSAEIREIPGTPVSGTYLYDTRQGSFQLQSHIDGYAETIKTTAWKSSSTKIAEIDPTTGAVTVHGSGTATFTLTVTAINGKTATDKVKVKFGIYTDSLTVTPGEAVTLRSGESYTFTATGEPDNVTTSGCTWVLSHKNAGTISSKGVFKAKTVTNPTEVILTAVSKDGYCTSDAIRITVLPKEGSLILYRALEDGLKGITKTTQTVKAGDTWQLAATEDVTWTSSKPSIAEVTKEGVLTAKANGSATITATTADGTKASFTLKVSKLSAAVAVSVKNGAAPVAASGKSLNLAGTVTYSDGSKDTKVTWSLAPTALATLSSSGKLTAAKNLTTGGTVTVTATAKDGTGAAASLDVQIVPAATALEIRRVVSGETTVDVTNTTLTLDLNTVSSLSLSAWVFPTGSQQNVTWKSSNKKVAEIDENGKVTGLKAGTVTITATAQDGSGKKAACKITVLKAARTLQLPQTAFVGGGKSLTMTKLDGYALDPEATVQKLAWSMTMVSGNAERAVPSTIASLSAAGVLKTKAVTEPVTLRVRAATTDGSRLAALCTVTVYPAAKGVTLHNASGEDITKDTLSLAASGSLTLFPDTTNVKGYGTADDGTADESLRAKDAWTITASRTGLTWDASKIGQITVSVSDPAALSGKTVKLTVKANDGSGKSAYINVKIS